MAGVSVVWTLNLKAWVALSLVVACHAQLLPSRDPLRPDPSLPDPVRPSPLKPPGDLDLEADSSPPASPSFSSPPPPLVLSSPPQLPSSPSSFSSPPPPLPSSVPPPPLLPAQQNSTTVSYTLRFYKHRASSSDTQWLLTNTVAGYENSTLLGLVRVQDDTLTATQDPESQVVGRARGAVLFESSDASPISFEQLFTNTFYDGMLDGLPGGSIIYRGFDPIMELVREVAVVGGTGFWSAAWGYCVQTLVYQDADRLTIEYLTYIFLPLTAASSTSG